MNFRQYGGLSAKVITATDPEELEKAVNATAEQFDIIDLQYSTTTINDSQIEYSVFMLVGEKGAQS